MQTNGWQIIISKDAEGQINVIYQGDLNLYEVLSLLELEREKLKRTLVERISEGDG